MQVAIVGSVHDAHPLIVRERLIERGLECVILDPDEANFLFSIELGCKSEPTIRLTIENGDEFAPSVFWWRTKPKNYRFKDDDKQNSVEFAQREWAHSLRSLLFATSARVINQPEHQYLANHKPMQLVVAQEIGFEIPETHFTNDFRSMPKSETGIIYKPLTWLATAKGEMLFANKLDETTLSGQEDSIRAAPCIFQSFVDKMYEVRVSVFGSRVFGTKVDSQKLDRTKVDWRRGILQPIYAATEVPQEIEERVLRFLSRFGLQMGMFDFVVDQDGNWIFLECNPAGQWIWLEEATGAPLTAAFVDLLQGSSSD